MKKKVFVGISGGVDSAVAAHLLIEQGYDVTGVFLKNWSGEEYGLEDQCPWEEDLESAKTVCEHLNIPLKIYNFEKEYREAVIKDFFYQYSIGNTPNPDVLCNKYIKFKSFLERALSEGADLIATGHYTSSDGTSLYKATDRSKDQTYFLYQLDTYQISRSLFPLGKLLKKEVREIANKIKLPNAERKDSQGICFLGKIDVVDFLKNELKEKKGEIVDFQTNKTVGYHNGVWFYTVGQRHGLGIGGVDIPYFVMRKDVEHNRLYVVQGSNNKLLYCKKVKLSMISGLDETGRNLTAQTRYHGTFYRIDYDKGKKTVSFLDPAWAVACGQSVVVYDGQKCLGGGVVEELFD